MRVFDQCVCRLHAPVNAGCTRSSSPWLPHHHCDIIIPFTRPPSLFELGPTARVRSASAPYTTSRRVTYVAWRFAASACGGVVLRSLMHAPVVGCELRRSSALPRIRMVPDPRASTNGFPRCVLVLEGCKATRRVMERCSRIGEFFGMRARERVGDLTQGVRAVGQRQQLMEQRRRGAARRTMIVTPSLQALARCRRRGKTRLSEVRAAPS